MVVGAGRGGAVGDIVRSTSRGACRCDGSCESTLEGFDEDGAKGSDCERVWGRESDMV